nr:ERV-BabFcenv provirus ancestral Env polyprotein isoform X1 [Dasypus novemcinctus]XP_058157391.1 ERV-BabFcenv provirus ancestral Env polyprotein isoform X1 [Dasypus novemcinctus]XP_058157393.1 ERV-BabFcenv provirus ancestral Env polyprotein isoform X1 [Dasypus novemcinctus]XP_058157394.1 ERV-BabFcenv provirus ancestral Env polyprotein isoform X1 [Dasypus novemcinctus]XP_058157395.1 ERV-BabFcenv provirus ancestral Env polyprotein isoform X1 [Dasypus novemcinctus]XP_058157396.1 ERV-BabFcenv pr
MFTVKETITSRSSTTSRPLGTGHCSPQGCQTPLTIKLTETPKSYQQSSRKPYACFPHTQTKAYCTNTYYQGPYYGGCPYWSCVINWPWQSSFPNFFFANKSGYYLHIKDPWNDRWATGITGKLYAHGGDTWPTRSIMVSHRYSLYNQSSSPISISNMLVNIKTAKKQLNEQLLVYNPPSLLTILNNTVSLLNQSGIANISHCFLCTSLQCPLLAAVPVSISNYSNYSSATPGNLSSPLTQIPLWSSPENITCFQTSHTSFSPTCTTNVSFTGTIQLPRGLFFWCNRTITPLINSTTPGPCIPVVIVPQFILYTESKASQLLSSFHSKRAAFLPLLVGASLTSSLAAVGLASGTLAHTVIVTGNFKESVQIAFDSTTASLQALQEQLISLASVTLQNSRALDLLTAKKGGTCLFLQEECCFYINSSGIVGQNIQILKDLPKNLKLNHSVPHS